MNYISDLVHENNHTHCYLSTYYVLVMNQKNTSPVLTDTTIWSRGFQYAKIKSHPLKYKSINKPVSSVLILTRGCQSLETASSGLLLNEETGGKSCHVSNFNLGFHRMNQNSPVHKQNQQPHHRSL